MAEYKVDHSDYALAYNDYWLRADRIGSDSCDLCRIAEFVVECCGYGRTLDVGCGEGRLVGELLKLGVDTHGVDVSNVVINRCLARYPERFTQGSVLELPFEDDEFKTIVSTDCLEHIAPEDVSKALKELHRVSKRFVLLQIATTQDRDNHWHLTIEPRAWWEARCFEVGFRLHSRSFWILPYEAREHDGPIIIIALEKIPSQALTEYPMEVLEKNRILHMDMLRETGRRSDAHCVRYHMAAQYIRPGDVVLDVACGLGYGSHILYQNSQATSVLGVDASEFGVAYAQNNYGMGDVVLFRLCDAQNLSILPDNSVDFITSFETIEHLSDPATYLVELKRVLRPSGRLMISAPNDWTNETGKDPNPHHLHIYTWERLLAECRSIFLIEKGFVQTAGGAMKYHNAPRMWQEVLPASTLDTNAEWILLLCMADPVAGQEVPYQETVWETPQSVGFNVSAFARDYLNPWLVKGMVALGMRSESPENLRRMQEKVLQVSPPDAVDYGAALCGRAYAMLGADIAPEDEYMDMLERIRAYADIKAPTPHQLRWQVSLLFAGAELSKVRGSFVEASNLYTACSARDVTPYSPLLGNKTLDALFWLALLALQAGDSATARIHLKRCIIEAQRFVSGSWLNIIGDMDHPLPFGLAEMAQLLDKTSRAAYMLYALESEERRPGIFHCKAKGYYEVLLDVKDNDLRALRQSVKTMTQEIARQDAHAQELAREVTRQDAHAQELAREVTRQDAHAQELAREVARQDAHAQELAREVARQDAHAQELAREVVQQNAYIRELEQKLAIKHSKNIMQRLSKKFFPK